MSLNLRGPSSSALSATYARPRSDNARPLVHKLKSGLPAAVCILGDSTGNGTNEWFHTSMAWLAAQFPAFTVREWLWNDTNQRFDAPSVVQTGTGGAAYFRTLTNATFLTTPDSAAVSLTGDHDIRIKAALDDWTPTTTDALAGKFGGVGQRSWRLELVTDGTLYFNWSSDGTNSFDAFSSAPVPFANGQAGWVRVYLDVDNGAAGKTVTFYTSTDGNTWAQLGAAVTSGTVTSVFDSNNVVQLGGRGTGGAGTGFDYPANWYAFQILNSAGVPVIDLDAGSMPVAGAFNDYAGNVWTINGGTITKGGAPELALWNASTSGKDISYSNDGTRFPKQTPQPCDLAFISYSHNDGTTVAYRAPYKQLADALIAKWPDVGVVAVVQNPKKAPATWVTEHAVRGQQIVSLAMSQRYGLVNAYRAFLDTGNSDALIDNTDGIHPLQAGFDVWRDEAKKLFLGWL